MYDSNVRITEHGYIIDEKEVHIRLTSGEDIWGKINIADYDVTRLSELFTKSDLYFIVVSNCHDSKSEDDDGHVMFINKDHVLWVEPV